MEPQQQSAEQSQRAFEEKIGLGYLFKSGKVGRRGISDDVSQSAPASQEAADVNMPLQALAARRVLEAIAHLEEVSSSRGTKLSAVAENVGLTAEVLLPVVRQLEETELVETIETTAFGDNVVTVTDRAKELLAQSDPVDLMQLLIKG